MRYHSPSRRHFLQGLGRAALTLPLLPSLMPHAAGAQGLSVPRFFVATWVGHGGISYENTYPLDGATTLTQTEMYPASGGSPAHIIRSARLRDCKVTHASTAAARQQVLSDFDAGAARVSPLIGSYVSDALLDKMNVLRGIDFLTWGFHNRGFLGNFLDYDGGPTQGRLPTIDAVIASSNTFYSAAERALLRAPSVAMGWVDLSATRSGTAVAPNPFKYREAGALFDRLFQGVQSTPGQQVDPRVSLVDRVHQDYVRLARGAFGPGRRLSADDRVRLEEYVASLSDISTRMRATTGSSCSVPTITSGQRARSVVDTEWNTIAGATAGEREANQRAAMELTNMILVAAFMCGSTRQAALALPALVDQWNPSVFNTPNQIEPVRTDAHGMCFHNHTMPDRQQLLMRGQRYSFEYGYLDLVKRMANAQVVPGVSMLDQAVVYWGGESGPVTHDAKCMPTVITGGGAGYFKTGYYVDYTHRTRGIRPSWGGPNWFAGVPQNRLLANFAQAMGLVPADYELSDAAYATKYPARGGRVPGYGDPTISPGDDKAPYPVASLNDMSVGLPVIT